MKIIAFSKSHLGAELLAFYSSKQNIPVRVHRAGLLPQVRKSVEDLFKNGNLKAISATLLWSWYRHRRYRCNHIRHCAY